MVQKGLTDEELSKLGAADNDSGLTDKQLSELEGSGNSFFAQPSVEKRSLLDLFKQGTGIQDFTKKQAPSFNLQDLMTPWHALGKPELADAITGTPAMQALTEGLRREEAIFANSLRKINEGNADVADVLEAGYKGFTGKEISTFGNYFEDIGFNDFSAASAGFLLSLALPSNLYGAKLLKGSGTKQATKKVDTLIQDVSGHKALQAEVSSKMTGIPKEDFEFVLTRDPEKLFNGKYDTLLPKKMAQRISNGLNDLRSKAGAEVGKIKSELKLDTRPIDTSRLSGQFDDAMKKYGFTNERKFLQESGLKGDLDSLNSIKNSIISSENTTIEQLLNFRDELGEIAYSGFKRGGEKAISKPTEKADAVLRSWRNHITKQIHDVAPELVKADRKYVVASALRERGAKFFDDVSRGEKILSSIDKESMALKDKLLIKNIVKKVSGAEDWLDAVRTNIVRKNFSGVLPKGVMQRLVGGVALGVGAIPNPAQPVGLTIALASSPYAVKQAMLLGQKGKNAIGSLLRSVTSGSARKAVQKLLGEES